MKMFKKLMAVALAGVMALVVLTGCAASVNKKELAALLSDMDSFDSNYFDSNYKVEYKETSKDQANKVIELVQKAYNNTKEEDKANFDPMDALYSEDDENWNYPEINKALGIDDKTEDEYGFAIVELKKYSSQYNQDHATMMLAKDVLKAREWLNDDVNAKGNNGTVSINTVTLGSTEYLVVVFKVVA